MRARDKPADDAEIFLVLIMNPTLRAHLTFDARSKSRLLVLLDNGEQAALVLERGRLLHGGERVRLEDGRYVEIVAVDEPLLEAMSPEPLLIAKAAYHLGNRHVAIQFVNGGLRFLADRVLGEMVTGLGLKVTALEAPFEPEGGAYGHQHAHGSAPLSTPKIHSYSSP
jgi:urease accessory protein